MVFVNRHLKVPKWFKEWYDKLDPPKELYDKVPYKKIPYAIAKVLNVNVAEGWRTNVWDPIVSPHNYLYRDDWYPKNIDGEKTNQCTNRNKLYLIEALVDKSLATDEVNVELDFNLSKDIEKVLLIGNCYHNLLCLTEVAVLGYSMEINYDVPRELKSGFVTEIQKNYLPYVIYLLDQNKEDSPKWK